MKNRFYTLTIESESINIDEQLVIRAMGYKEKTYPESLPGLIREILSTFHSYLAIHAGWMEFREPVISTKNGKILYNGHEFTCGSIIARELIKSEVLYIFMVTIGPGIEKWSREQSSQNRHLYAYIIDTVGTISVELSADVMGDFLFDKVKKKGHKITNRYSPGYCKWDIAEQHKLFSCFPPGFCGITLTDTALMLPVKSVSGILGSGEKVEKRLYRCGICSLKDCIMRNMR